MFIVCKNKASTRTSDDKEQFLSTLVEVITLATLQAGIFLSRETTDNKWLASCQFQEKDWRESRLDVPQWRLLKKSCQVRRRGRDQFQGKKISRKPRTGFERIRKVQQRKLDIKSPPAEIWRRHHAEDITETSNWHIKESTNQDPSCKTYSANESFAWTS